MIRAYTLHCGDPSDQAVLVFAHNAREAKRLGYKLLDDVDRFIDVVAQRADVGLPPAVPWPTEPRALDWYRAADRAVYRAIGWHCEGEGACAACDLYPCGDDEHALCGGCDQCPECGHHPTECTDAWVPGVTPLWRRDWVNTLEGGHAVYHAGVLAGWENRVQERLRFQPSGAASALTLERWKVEGEPGKVAKVALGALEGAADA